MDRDKGRKRPVKGDAYRTSLNQVIHLGNILGKGGEGEIYEVQEDPALCAKLYTDGAKGRAIMEPKIAEMIEIYKRVRTTSPHQEYLFDHHLAWPRARLYHPDQGYFVGFLMNRLDLGSCEILNNFLTADHTGNKGRKNRLELAANLLDMLVFLHGIGVVVGDLHEENIFVRQDLKVVFIDCDSYQIKDRFKCTAMRLEISPPEAASGKALTPAADVFEFSILLYRLLMDGFNPFAFRQGSGDRDILFPERKEKGLAPIRDSSLSLPKRSPPLSRIPKQIADQIARGLDPNPSRRSRLSDMKAVIEKELNVNTGSMTSSTSQRYERGKRWAWSLVVLALAMAIFCLAANPVWVKGARHDLRTWSEDIYAKVREVRWRYYLGAATSMLKEIEAKFVSGLPVHEQESSAHKAEPVFLHLSPGEFWSKRGGGSIKVVITRSFYIMDRPVTYALWDRVMKSKVPHRCPECPVVGVSWWDVQRFLKALNSNSATAYSLPTEAQWEYAALRSDSMGDGIWEWCSDWYGESVDSRDEVDPEGPGFGSHKVVKGRKEGMVIRMAIKPGVTSYHVGFRLMTFTHPAQLTGSLASKDGLKGGF